MKPGILLGGPLLAMLAAGLGAGAAGAREPPASEPIPVLAWIGPPAPETTAERYRELADCGFTTNFTPLANPDEVARALEAAQAAGVGQFISAPELARDPEGVASRFRGHPALAGYHLRDEPSAADFPELARWARRLQTVDAAHPCYINLLPNYATPAQLGTATYQEYVDRFVAEVPVPFLSFDHYPVTGAGLRPEWYENLEIISRAAHKADKPFWAFVLAVAHDPYPVAQIEHLRLQAFSNLAYGAACIQYFTYWTPKSTVWNFHQAPVEEGKRTPVYGRVKQVNEEIRGLSRVFTGAKVARVGHTGRLPRGTEAFRPEAPVAELRTEGDGGVVSLLRKGRRSYLVVVNRDYRASMPLAVTFDGSRKVDEERMDGTLMRAGRQLTRNVGPGDIVVMGWED
jgi:hypothetical protein